MLLLPFAEESAYLMILKGSQIIDLSPDGSGRAGQLSPVVGVQGAFDVCFVLILNIYVL